MSAAILRGKALAFGFACEEAAVLFEELNLAHRLQLEGVCKSLAFRKPPDLDGVLRRSALARAGASGASGGGLRAPGAWHGMYPSAGSPAVAHGCQGSSVLPALQDAQLLCTS